jgi:DHA2 family multidrug resistance protein
MAWDIQSMTLFRVIQGFVGGAMVPTVFATGFVLFSGPQRAMIPAILGMVSVLAPTLGPTVGGLLTDAVGWRSIFYINILPGIAVTILAATFIRVDRPNLAMLKRIDYSHLLSMAVFLGGLEYVLEEGSRHDWFDDPHIVTAAWLSAVALALFIERSFNSRGPIVKLSPYRRPTFVFANVFNLVIGFGIYSATYLVPLYLGRVRGYSSTEIGLTVFITGIAQIASTVIAARLSQRADPRKVIVVGLILFAISLRLTSYMTPEWGFAAFAGPLLLRGFASMLCIVPSVGLALNGFDATEVRYASALFNLMRNLGGAIGIAVVNTWLQDDTRWHVARFGEALGEAGRAAPQVVGEIAQRMQQITADSAQALLMAQAEFAKLIARAALTQGFNDVFRVMSWVFLAALILVPFCKPLPSTAPARASE